MSQLESFFVGTQLIATRPHFAIETNGGALYQGVCVLLFCPSCGEVWGRRFIPQVPWVAAARHCKRHGWQTLLDPDSEWLSLEIAVELPSVVWPTALVTYELTAIQWELDRRSAGPL